MTPVGRVVARSIRSVSRLQPVCSMSKTTNSAPAVAINRPRPVLSNSKTIVPSDTPPARSVRLTVLTPMRKSRGCGAVFVVAASFPTCRVAPASWETCRHNRSRHVHHEQELGIALGLADARDQHVHCLDGVHVGQHAAEH